MKIFNFCASHISLRRFIFRASALKWKALAIERENEGCIDPASWVKSSWAKGIGGFSPRSGGLWVCEESFGSGWFFLTRPSWTTVFFYLNFFRQSNWWIFFFIMAASILGLRPKNSSEDDEESCKASERWREETNALRALVSSWKVNGWWRYSTSVLRT